MKIFQAINGVMSEMNAIPKDKTNTQQGFKFRGIDDVMNALQPLLVKHGIFIVPEVLEQLREDRISSKEKALIYSVCKIKYTFFADDGSSFSAITIGEGMDSGDKATNKAMAIAFKYACFQVFCIPTQDMADPDADTHEIKPSSTNMPNSDATWNQLGTELPPEEAPKNSQSGIITKPQAARMFAISGGNKDICSAVMKKYGYEKSTDIKKSDYAAMCNEIEKAAKMVG